jgi:hypothetical protein
VYDVIILQAGVQGLEIDHLEHRRRDCRSHLISFWLYDQQQLSDIHDSFANSNLRTRIVELRHGDAVHANIAPQIVDGVNTLVLDVEFPERSEEQRGPYELEAAN